MDPAMNRRCRALLEARRAVLLPGVANALAARIVADVGFEAVYVTGAGIANTFHGVPDIGLVSLSEVVAHISAIREAVDLPVLADGDTGFGNAVNTARTVQLFERAGASAIQLEDQVFPKKCGHFAGKDVIETREMVEKIKAAADARRDAGFTIIARTDARAVHGFDDAVERVSRYFEAGAEATFIEAPLSLDEICRIPKEAPGLPILNIVHGGRTPMPDRGELQALGFSGVIYANAALQAGMLATHRVLGHLLRQGSLAGAEDQLAGFAERQRMVAKHDYDALELRHALKPPATHAG
jgi:2-methylisocitrate lyase-like PEP mutase family enzyme